MDTHYFLGLSLAQSAEYTALAVLERTLGGDGRENPWAWHYAVRHLERFQLGTPYGAVLDWLAKVTGTPPLEGAMLVLDRTSVGRPIADDFRRRDLPVVLRSVVITLGQERSLHRGTHHVPRTELTTVMQMALQGQRLKVAEQLPQASVLCQELMAFQPRARTTADDILNWRERDHDDLVLAVAVAVWMSERERAGPSETDIPVAASAPAWWEDGPGWVPCN